MINLMLLVMQLFYKRRTRQALHHALCGRNRARHTPTQGRFTAAEVDGLLEATWRRFAQLAPQLPPAPAPMTQRVLLLAGLTHALFQVLLAAGVERAYAIELVG